MGGCIAKPTDEFSVSNFPLINDCSILEQIGSGAFSKVFKVECKDIGVAALKIISKRRVTDDSIIIYEIDIMKQLQYDHIVRLFYNSSDSVNYYLILELISGGELFDRIVKKTSYTESEARKILKTLLQVAQYLKSVKIIHRDIKPENLMLSNPESDSDIKLIDFGFAIREEEVTESSIPCGTPGYVSPEILCSRAYGCESDVWSLGVIFYILLSGYAPFYDDDMPTMFSYIKRGDYTFQPQIWSNISQEAKDLITKMLTVDQEARWTPDMLLAHEWMLADDDVLKRNDIGTTLVELKKFNARRKFRAAVKALIAVNRINKVIPDRAPLLGKI